VEVRIGIVQSVKELEVELDQSTQSDGLAKEIESALGKEGGVLWLTDRKGRKVCIPSARIAYVELLPGTEARRVGFGAS